jgi:hypothetical protein
MKYFSPQCQSHVTDTFLDCGATHVTKDEIIKDLKRRTPNELARGEKIDYGTYPPDQYEEMIKKDVKTIQEEKMLEGMTVIGFSFVTETGELKRIV